MFKQKNYKKMKRNKMTFEPKLSLAKKISIKALDFGKLPKKLMGG